MKLKNPEITKVWKKIYRMIAIVFAMAFAFSIKTDAAPETTVRVGMFPLGQFQNYDENGNPYGYNIDYLKKISETTHWYYEYVPAEGFTDALEMLRNGEVDIVAPVQMRGYIQETCDYSTYSMGNEFAAIYVLQDGTYGDVKYEDFDAMSQMHFGAVNYEGSGFTTAFIDKYSVKNHITPKEITYYDSMPEVLKALDNGSVDATVTNILFSNDEYKLLGRFSPMPSYYILQKDSKYLDDLNEAMTSILINDPSF